MYIQLFSSLWIAEYYFENQYVISLDNFARYWCYPLSLIYLENASQLMFNFFFRMILIYFDSRNSNNASLIYQTEKEKFYFIYLL